MFRRSHTLPAWLAALALLLAPLPGAAEAVLVTGAGKASAALNFRVVIPPVMRVIENSHPTQIEGDQPVEQRLVVLSNMKHGFCASLRLNDPQLTGWRLTTEETGGVTLQPLADGYRLCANRPGRFSLRLQHEFAPGPLQAAQTWPVQTELLAL